MHQNRHSWSCCSPCSENCSPSSSCLSTPPILAPCHRSGSPFWTEVPCMHFLCPLSPYQSFRSSVYLQNLWRLPPRHIFYSKLQCLLFSRHFHPWRRRPVVQSLPFLRHFRCEQNYLD